MGWRNLRLTRIGTRVSAAIALAAALLLLVLIARQLGSSSSPNRASAANGAVESSRPSGLLLDDPRAFQGYTLIAPMTSRNTQLIDMQGKIVRSWESQYPPAHSAYLLENGHLLRTCDLGTETRSFGAPTGAGGRVQEFDWDGQLVWEFKLSNERQLPHHDVAKLPNGNVLMIVWDKKTAQEAIAAGRRPDSVGEFLLPDTVVEVKPTGKSTGDVVWEWHVWDHLVQDFDKSKPNFGKTADHPELVDINYGQDTLAPILATPGGLDKLKSIGYVGAGTSAAAMSRVTPDWTHFNAVAYNPDLDQIVVTVHSFSEFWVIDHGTTTTEAAGHVGGKSGKGGDILYRWGNPRAYGTGTKADQRLFAPHDAHWIARGLPGEGHFLVFNNGTNRPGGNHSSVDEIESPADANGCYHFKPGVAFGPERPVWSYTAPDKAEFYSILISGAQRLPNGNTLVCSGADGLVFEVNAAKEVVWKYANLAPSESRPILPSEAGPGGSDDDLDSSRLVLTQSHQDAIKLTAEQKQQLRKLQEEVGTRLDKFLTTEQKEQFREALDSASDASAAPGQIMSAVQQKSLELTGEQKKHLISLEREVDRKLDQMLTADQKQQLKQVRASAGALARGAGPVAAGMRGLGSSSLFRAYRYAPDYPGLAGKALTRSNK
jgi:hypothetical protein